MVTAFTTEIPKIAGDRRDDRRYGIRLELRWKLIHRRKVLHVGDGHTLDLSSGGILFDPLQQLPIGLTAELSIAWPVLLNDVTPMQLLVTGRIVRSMSQGTAIRLISHEFRTSAQRLSVVPTRTYLV